MSKLNQMDFRRMLLAARKRIAGGGWVNFKEGRDRTESVGFKANKRPGVISGVSESRLRLMLLNQEAHLSRLTSCLRLGTYAYLQTPQPFQDVFEHKVSPEIQCYISSLPREVVISNRKPVAATPSGIKKLGPNAQLPLVPLVPDDGGGSDADEEGEPALLQPTMKRPASSVTKKTGKQGVAALNRQHYQQLAKLQSASQQLVLKLSKIVNRRNSRFYKTPN